MNKNKKIALWLTVAALVFAFISIFMGFANGMHHEQWNESTLLYQYDVKFWDIVFNKGNIVVDLFHGKSNAGLVITFVLTILVILLLASTVVLNLLGKANQKLNKGLMISSAVVLLVIALMMFLAKGICVIPDDEQIETFGITYIFKNKLLAGPICWSIFTLIGGVAMIVAATQNKKANVQA